MRKILDFVLINRYRTSPAMFPMPSREKMQVGRVKGAKVVFARTSISSMTGEEKVLKLGYSDEIVVYLNQKPIFSEKNASVVSRRRMHSVHLDLTTRFQFIYSRAKTNYS